MKELRDTGRQVIFDWGRAHSQSRGFLKAEALAKLGASLSRREIAWRSVRFHPPSQGQADPVEREAEPEPGPPSGRAPTPTPLVNPGVSLEDIASHERLYSRIPEALRSKWLQVARPFFLDYAQAHDADDPGRMHDAAVAILALPGLALRKGRGGKGRRGHRTLSAAMDRVSEQVRRVRNAARPSPPLDMHIGQPGRPGPFSAQGPPGGLSELSLHGPSPRSSPAPQLSA